MKRSPLRRKTRLAPGPAPERRTRLRPVSDRRRDEKPTRDEVRRLVSLRDQGACQGPRRAPWIRCWHPEGEPLDVHEVIPRSAWREGYLEVTNCLLLCRGHHDWVGDYPAAAAAVGLHGYSWQRPDQQGDHR